MNKKIRTIVELPVGVINREKDDLLIKEVCFRVSTVIAVWLYSEGGSDRWFYAARFCYLLQHRDANDVNIYLLFFS
ncbi:MAG: hypothetical protein QM296_13330 [Bacillota bacterium]|nr:hypothetical protein [Bacillota bacterium]